MAYVIKCRTKRSHDGVPAGFEFQVVSSNKSWPSGPEVADALKKAVFLKLHLAIREPEKNRSLFCLAMPLLLVFLPFRLTQPSSLHSIIFFIHSNRLTPILLDG